MLSTRSLRIQRLGQSLDKGSNFVSNAPVMVPCFFVGVGRLGQPRRVVKSYVPYPGVARKNRARFMRVAANRDDVIEIDVAKLVEVLGPMPGNVDARFSHHLDGDGIQTVRFDARRIGL